MAARQRCVLCGYCFLPSSPFSSRLTPPTPPRVLRVTEKGLAGAHSLLMVVFLNCCGPFIAPVLHSALGSSHCLLCFFPLSLFLVLQIHTSLALLKNPFSFPPRLHGPRSYVPGITVGGTPPSSPAVSPFLSRTTMPAGKRLGVSCREEEKYELGSKMSPTDEGQSPKTPA